MSDAAVATIVSGAIAIATMIVGFLTLWIKLRYGVERVQSVEKKIDDNTKITKEGVASASVAATKADLIAERVNGKLEQAIKRIANECNETVLTKLTEHAAQDERNMSEIRTVLEDLKRKIK